MPLLRLGFASLEPKGMSLLSVDGMTERGPNLSHWPGNRTPARWKADLSTEIALQFARAPSAEREDFLGPVEVVANDHYDTDGFGALLAILDPATAFRHEEILVEAAAAGDFGRFGRWRGFAVDRIVSNLAEKRSPVASEFRGLADGALALARYEWLLAHAERVLGAVESLSVLYEEDLARQREEIASVLRGGLDRRVHPRAGLSVLRHRAPFGRVTLNTFSAAFRVLDVREEDDGPRYRFHDRTESWFDLVTIHAPARRDLRPLARRLQAIEGEDSPARWCADPLDEPIPELYCGVESPQQYGRITRELLPSRLDPETVEREFVRFFAEEEAGREDLA
ncbi:MAG: hypothetical protein Fur0037_00660 [Planctomycetota bacterium]